MARPKKYSVEIDEFDLKNIINKSRLLKKIIYWLEYLATLDTTVKTDAEYEKIMNYLNNKVEKLDNKCERAQKDMEAEAEILNEIYNGR